MQLKIQIETLILVNIQMKGNKSVQVATKSSTPSMHKKKVTYIYIYIHKYGIPSHLYKTSSVYFFPVKI